MGNNTSQFEVGDILRFSSFPLHYAVYIGDGEIVHYNNKDGFRGIIREKLKDYLQRAPKSKKGITISKKVAIVTYEMTGTKKTPTEIRERALRYVDKEDYNVLLRNCEHFATWCVYGKPVSGQVRVAAVGAGTVAATTVGTGGGATIGGIVGSVIPGAGTVAGAFVGGVIGAGVGAAVGVIGAGLGLIITHVVYEVQEESEEFE